MTISAIIYVDDISETFDSFIESIAAQTTRCDEVLFVLQPASYIYQQLIEESNLENTRILSLNISGEAKPMIHKVIQDIKSEFVVFADSQYLWNPTYIETLKTYGDSEADLFMYDALDPNKESLLGKLNFSIKDKILVAQDQANQAIAKMHNLPSALVCVRRKIIQKFTQSKKDALNESFSWILSASLSASQPEKIEFVHETLLEVVDSLQVYIPSPSEKMLWLEQVLEHTEQGFFRRAHYFLFMRESAKKQSFFRRFISLNTLLLEGDYKRFTNRPIQTVMSDLFH